MWIPPAYSPLRIPLVVRSVAAGVAAIEELEGYLAKRFQADAAIFTHSGTQALQLAIQLARVATTGRRNIVALPGYGCYDLVSALVGAECSGWLYDISPQHLDPVPKSLERAAEHCAVLIVANMFGFPLDWDVIDGVAGRTDSVVIEDAAQGIGSGWGDREGGTLGDLTVLSFGRGKGWTGGAGGALLIRNLERFPALGTLPNAPGTRLALVAKSFAQCMFSRPSLYGLPARVPSLRLGESIYREPSPPRNGHPSSAALIMSSKSLAEAECDLRRDRAARLRQLHKGDSSGVAVPLPRAGGRTSDLRFPILIDKCPPPGPGAQRHGLYRSYPMTLAELPASLHSVANLDDPRPGCDRLARELYTLPTHSLVPRDRLRTVLATLNDEEST